MSAAEPHEAADLSPGYAIVGRVRRAQGIRGEVTVELVTDDGDRIFAPGARVLAGTPAGDLAPGPAGGLPLTIESAHPFRGGLIVKFDAIPDRTAAERWNGRYLLVPAGELTPPAADEVFVHQLIGLRVRGDDGRDLGRVAAFYELPQGLTLEVRGGEAGDVLVPYRSPLVREVDLAAGTLLVETGSGLFD